MNIQQYCNLYNCSPDTVETIADQNYWEAYRKLRDQEWLAENCVDSSYCDSDTGYNIVSEYSSSREYNETFQELKDAKAVLDYLQENEF